MKSGDILEESLQVVDGVHGRAKGFVKLGGGERFSLQLLHHVLDLNHSDARFTNELFHRLYHS